MGLECIYARGDVHTKIKRKKEKERARGEKRERKKERAYERREP